MTLREKMEKSYDSMDCCKAVRLLDGKIVTVLHEGKIEGIEIDGSERTVTPELIHSIAVVVNDSYDCYGGWDDTHILLDTVASEMPCCKCPWFDVCTVMDEEIDE